MFFDTCINTIYLNYQLVNEEEPPQEGAAQDAPPPYSSIAAANAGQDPLLLFNDFAGITTAP